MKLQWNPAVVGKGSFCSLRRVLAPCQLPLSSLPCAVFGALSWLDLRGEQEFAGERACGNAQPGSGEGLGQ